MKKTKKPNLLHAKKYNGMILGDRYRTRDGAVVRHVVKGGGWCAPVLFVKVGTGKTLMNLHDFLWRVRCLAAENLSTPQFWNGGAHGTDLDIVAKWHPKHKKYIPTR